MTALALTSRRRSRIAFATAPLAVGEFLADKGASTPSRLEVGGMVPRLVFGSMSGALIGRRRGESVGLPALVGLVGAVAGALLGSRWRSEGAEKLGIGALPAALVEDAVVTVAAIAAVARTQTSSR